MVRKVLTSFGVFQCHALTPYMQYVCVCAVYSYSEYASSQ